MILWLNTHTQHLYMSENQLVKSLHLLAKYFSQCVLVIITGCSNKSGGLHFTVIWTGIF